MKQNSINDLPKLEAENFENLFSINQDANGMYYYNLLQSISFPTNLPANLFTKYYVKAGDTWPFISYKTLKTPNLWWLILLANKIDNPTIQPVVGQYLLIPITQVVQQILYQIR